MLKWEDRFFLFALASASVAFVLFVVDLGETPLIFENWRAEAFFFAPFLISQGCTLLHGLRRGSR